MPALTENRASSEIRVAASAAFELMWLMHNAAADHVLGGSYTSQERIRNRYGEEIKAFWDDGIRGSTDVVVLAQRAGALFDLDLAGFFGRFDQAADDPAPVPALLSETVQEREAFGERLRRLAADGSLRARYLALLKAVWSEVQPEWDSTGRAAVVAESGRWRQRLQDGAGFRDVLERRQIWKGRPSFEDLADASAEDGRLVLSPGWFYGDIHVVELDGTLYLGHGIQAPDAGELRRAVATHVSSGLKALADPTRVAILMWLAREPASVTEIARQFKLAQPTVSAHVQVLREAGLLEERITGRSARLSTSEEAVRRFFGEAQESLVRTFRA